MAAPVLSTLPLASLGLGNGSKTTSNAHLPNSVSYFGNSCLRMPSHSTSLAFESRTSQRNGHKNLKTFRPSSARAAVGNPWKLVGLKEALRYNKIGDSDLMVSEVTLGTMTWGNQNTEAEAHEQLSFAFDNGVNIFDSAEMYPIPSKDEHKFRTDQYIASWLKYMPRDKVVVATKVAGYAPWLNWLREDGDFPRVDAKNIRESVEGSLRRLGVDCIDLLQIHWPDRYVPLFGAYEYKKEQERESVSFVEQLEAMQEMIKEGKIRYVGLSNETSFGVMKFLEASEKYGLPKVVSIQNCFSLLVRTRFEIDLVEVCAPNNGNVSLLAYSPLAGGVLSGKYLDKNSEAYKIGRLSLFPGYMDRYTKPFVTACVEEYCQLANKHGLTPSQLALAFVRDRCFVGSTIIGATSMEQLQENLSAFTLECPLNDEIEKGINDIFSRYRDPASF
eukprot:TRINITY_DN5629_c0_g1_i1.p1 TRINITY_DN5629_c0_g1~~TRINITY_DN5629_c0_g1_i1.p1  ORF type:complete len:445 (-),score=69.94 TRINITY_DN5629_c0_g1_i1:234-1568(-)